MKARVLRVVIVSTAAALVCIGVTASPAVATPPNIPRTARR
jgi:hypothetical protein